jgi:uncharacterized protein (DUF3084 family)
VLLGKSVQQLFDDCAVLDQRVQQFNTWLQCIKERHQMAAETTPQQVFERLATTTHIAQIQSEVDALVDLLKPARRRGWFNWLFGQRGRKKDGEMTPLLLTFWASARRKPRYFSPCG